MPGGQKGAILGGREFLLERMVCMEQFGNFTVERRPHGVTRITDASGVHCFLVEGRERALLIDTMTGLKGLKELVASLTALPVEAALTHGHMDHAGGVYEWGQCYLHPLDVPMLDGKTLPARVGYVAGQLAQLGKAPLPEAAFVPDGAVAFRPVEAGDVIDLGGRQLEVLHVPGHTRGSVCYLDRDSGDFFAGDACNSNTLLNLETSAPIETYLNALLALKERQDEIGTFYLFHGPTPVDKSCIDDNIQCCREILAGTDDKVPVDFLGRTGYLAKRRDPRTFGREDGRFGNIVYDPGKLRG